MINFSQIKHQYEVSLSSAWNKKRTLVKNLSDYLITTWISESQFVICGNGGSAAKANHLANDLLSGISPEDGKG